MAAKSDFAQKLLHDLRIRKERMAASQGSSRTSSTTRDTYRNPGNAQRGSRQTKTLESIGGPKAAYQRPMSSGGSNRALAIKEPSQQIVSYGTTQPQRSEHIGDLSMAFTYAVKNGGELMNMDFSSPNNTTTVIDFLHQIGRRSLHVGKDRNGSVSMPVLTSIQIKEISKGVQNLYEILRSGSTGMNVGKELMKGARGLEESLTMLVNLQDASEMMVSTQTKSRITLLEVDDEDQEEDCLKIVDQNQVALPRFSFDHKRSKKPNLALTDASSKLSTHRRSTSCGANSLGGVSSSNGSEKGRISNVIAKLMGLEDLPGMLDSQSKNTHEPRIMQAEKQVKMGSTSRPEKDVPVRLSSRKPEQSEDFNTKVIVDRQQSYSDRLDQLHERQERGPSGEAKEKIQQKGRSPEVANNVRQERVEKKKMIRVEKGNEIRRMTSRKNPVQEPEKRTQKSKQDAHQVKSKNLPSKELQARSSDANLKAQESEPLRTEGNVQPQVLKEKPVRRKKVEPMAVHRSTEAPRKKDDVLKRKSRPPNNFVTPLKHKLSVLKETRRKDVQISGSVSPKQEKTSIKDGIKIDPQETLETLVASKHGDFNERSIETGNPSENKPKKGSYAGIQVVLTEQEKQLKEILIKDQLFLSTAEALFKLNIPVGFIHVDDHNNHQGEETKLKLDCGYEILRRKARSLELSVHPYMKPSVSRMTIRFLDDLVKQLYKDLESLRLYGRNACDQYDEADYLHHMLEKDICNKHADVNSFWDFGWHMTMFAFVEKDEFVKEVEQDLLHTLIDEITEDLSSIVLAC